MGSVNPGKRRRLVPALEGREELARRPGAASVPGLHWLGAAVVVSTGRPLLPQPEATVQTGPGHGVIQVTVNDSQASSWWEGQTAPPQGEFWNVSPPQPPRHTASGDESPWLDLALNDIHGLTLLAASTAPAWRGHCPLTGFPAPPGPSPAPRRSPRCPPSAPTTGSSCLPPRRSRTSP